MSWKMLVNQALELQVKLILAGLYFTILVPIGIWFWLTKNIFNSFSPNSNWHDWPHKRVDSELQMM